MREGEFNEAESHNSFLEALNAWRGVPSKPAAPEQKGVKFEEKKPGSFFANIRKDEEFDLNCLPQYAEGGTKPDTEIADPKYGPKESCWTCYKLKAKADLQEFAGKQFCSNSCREKFAKDNMITCQRVPACPAEAFLKKDGVPRLGRWFCSDECCEADTDI